MKGSFEVTGEESNMHSQRYENARREFKNCIIMSPICFFISLILAFREWKPIMDEELEKEKQGA